MINGKYSPLNVNCMGALLNDTGLYIDPKAAQFMGSSNADDQYTPGVVVGTTILADLSVSINIAYTRIGSGLTQVSPTVYNNLINIGKNSIPLLGNCAPNEYTDRRTYSGIETRFGFLRNHAYQAYKEFHVNTGTYSEFLQTFNTCESFKKQSNKVINAFAAAPTYLKGVYSNMDDLISADIAGVTLSTLYWGQDLIDLGRSLDLATIDTFGNPDNLLRTMNKNRAISRALNIALLSSGLTTSEVNSILNGTTATTAQQKKIYGAFNVIIGQDLVDVLLPLNCQTNGLTSLADLLNIKKIFPRSFKTLTVPRYNSKLGMPTNSKTYYLIYWDNQVQIDKQTGYGTRLFNIMSEAQAYACDAFSLAMLQIKNIKNMNIEKFSQVVCNLETVSDLNLNGTDVPSNQYAASQGFNKVAKGSGRFNTYTTTDFFGCMAYGTYPWLNTYYGVKILTNLNIPGAVFLMEAYLNMRALLEIPGADVSNLQSYIDDANNAIDTILAATPQVAAAVNQIYGFMGYNLAIERNARDLALPNIADLTSNVTDVYTFIDNLTQYATDTEPYEAVQVLESISDITNEGGTSLIGSMREIRNALRLGLTGAELDNSVELAELATKLPKVSGKITINRESGDIPAVTGSASTVGSLAGSPETTLVPDNLNVFNMSNNVVVFTPDNAVRRVIHCNCDCWDNIPQ
jgi:hypothetical protein